jgi:chromosome segregation ATPase
MFVENDGPSNSSGDSVCNNEVSKDCVGHYVNNCCKALKKRIVEDAWDAITESQNGGSETEGLIMSNEYLSREIVTLKKDYKKQKDSLDTATNDLATATNDLATATNDLATATNAMNELKKDYKEQKDSLDTATNDLATAANAMNELVKSINADKEAREATKNAQKALLRRLLDSYEN